MDFLELDDILANLAGNIVRSYDFDGYAIALWNSADGMLINQCAQLPPRLQEIEPALRNFRFQPNGTTIGGLCFSENRAHIIDAQSVASYSETIQDLHRRWQFSTFAAWPIRLQRDGTETVLGVFSAFLDRGTISPEASAVIEQKLATAAPAIAAALEHEQVEVLDTGLLQQHELLRALSASNLGESVSAAADPVCNYLLRRTDFDMAAVVLHEDDALALRHDVFKPGYAHLQESWHRMSGLRFTPDVGDGLTTVVYAQNNHFMVDDVQHMSQAPFSAKDREVLQTLQSVRSYLLLPIRAAGKPVGVLWLLSLGQPVALDKNAIETMQLIADFLGTALRKVG
ncbi:GAF domain-containing protein [Janthinobacterium sp. 17J80-10]|uniref:GAF domain-containing protein n=1 Tax=Janthinobacterium sp. 17J80-10 TaxID=2497863 RepID=UPI0010055308|nr:GAF domain-containing protein [Janthinobacterium sp. 17J80-10]QAU35803.1 GAF domain-containing protein [Janthinobacterium sp. 17J80-10]